MFLPAAVLTLAMLAGAEPAAAPAPAEKVLDIGGVVYNEGLGVTVAAPQGWVFDPNSGVEQGFHAVMYPAGTTWALADDVMYVNFAGLTTGLKVQDYIEQETERFKTKHPKLVVAAAEPIQIDGGIKALVRSFSGDNSGNYETVAYAAQGDRIAVYVLSCSSAAGHAKYLPAFRKMVAESHLSTKPAPK